MAFRLTEPIAAELFDLNPILTPIDLVEITHPQLTTLRFAASHAVITFGGEVFNPRSIDIKIPNEGKLERNNRAEIDNTDLALSSLIRLVNLRPKPTLVHHVIDLDDPTTILSGPYSYEIDSVSHTTTEATTNRPVRFNLLVPDIRRAAYPGKTFNTVDFPGLQ